MNYKYIYGPVNSRRLKMSLGIDIIPLKHCSFNCIYCQVGKTSHITITRKRYTPTQEILTEIKDVLSRDSAIDYITFSGSGEPTLHSELGVLITGVRTMTSIPVAVLTNSSLIDNTDVQKDLQHASVIAPTLCSATDRGFRKIHRAHPGLHITSIINGLATFRKSYGGALWLEVMLLKGINDTDLELQELIKAIARIQPNRVHLNTVVRPPNEEWALPVSLETLARVKTMIGDSAEIIASPGTPADIQMHHNLKQKILGVLKRRPVTIDDISSITGINRHELTKHMTALLQKQEVKVRRHGDKIFYEITTEEKK